MDDATFGELGFPVDVDECGTLVRLTATIAQKSRHRAKILTHAHQRKKYEHMSVLEARVSDNKNCKYQLRKLMKEGGLDETDVVNVSHEVLA